MKFPAKELKTFLLSAVMLVLVTSCGLETPEGGGPYPPPQGTTATGTYQLNWDAVTASEVTGYRAYFSDKPIQSGNVKGFIETSSTSIQLGPNDYQLASGETLYVAISSIGDGGLESPVSQTVSIVVE